MAFPLPTLNTYLKGEKTYAIRKTQEKEKAKPRFISTTKLAKYRKKKKRKKIRKTNDGMLNSKAVTSFEDNWDLDT